MYLVLLIRYKSNAICIKMTLINKSEEVTKSLQAINSIMAKAVKKGILKKQYMSRKLSSLSNQIKKN